MRAGVPDEERLRHTLGNPGMEDTVISSTKLILILTVVFIITSTGGEEAFTEHTCAIFDVR